MFKSFLESLKPNNPLLIESLLEGFTTFYHGSPSGDLRGGTTGLHLGTQEAAKQALEARIGVPAEGEWDGTREYGKTLLAGKIRLNDMDSRGYNQTGFNVDAPKEDYYPQEGQAKYSDGTPVPLTAKPSIQSFFIKGKMTNSISNPHNDARANSLMKGQLKKGNAKSGYYYKNDAEHVGSISAVVPGPEHIEKVINESLQNDLTIKKTTLSDWDVLKNNVELAYIQKVKSGYNVYITDIAEPYFYVKFNDAISFIKEVSNTSINESVDVFLRIDKITGEKEKILDIDELKFRLSGQVKDVDKVIWDIHSGKEIDTDYSIYKELLESIKSKNSLLVECLLEGFEIIFENDLNINNVKIKIEKNTRVKPDTYYIIAILDNYITSDEYIIDIIKQDAWRWEDFFSKDDLSHIVGISVVEKSDEDNFVPSYTRIDKNFLRKGIATKMYNEVDKYLKEKLHPSSTQTYPARELWKKRLSKTQLESVDDNFKSWFNGSKILDKEGNPLIVYHGTDKTFDKFDASKGAQNIIWFTNDKSSIENGSAGAAGSGKIMNLYISLKNPANWKEYDNLTLDELQQRGYDGAILPEGKGFVGFVFDPDQIKIVNNSINESVEENKEYPKAGNIVDGLTVRKDVPNTDSISATFTKYKVLPGIREVPVSDFDASPTNMFYSKSYLDRVKSLAEQIKNNKEINPLIVVIHPDNLNEPYILEGGHRLAAMYTLGIKHFPALVVVDMDENTFYQK